MSVPHLLLALAITLVWGLDFVVVALSLIFEGPATIGHALVHADLSSVGAVLFNAWLVTTFGFGAWSVLLRRYPTAMVAPFALLVPVVGMASAAWLLDEPLHPWSLIAAALVIAGLAINQYAGSAGPASVRR